MKFFETKLGVLYKGDSEKILKDLPSDSVDSVVTDPPYGINFMGKKWDYDVPSVETWQEVLRVLKPGGYLLSFGGARTYHRLVVGIEDAGFEIRDQIMWIYGSGFPKSLDVGKAIDKAAGVKREVVGENPNHRPVSGVEYERIYAGGNTGAATITAPATPEAQQWDGWGTALKPAHEPIVVARKPLEESTVAANVLKYGTGGMNINEGRISLGGDYKSKANGRPSQTGLGDNYDPTKANQPDTVGRWPANVILQHTEECVQVGTKKVKGSPSSKTYHPAYGDGSKATGMLRGESHPGNQHGDSKGNETVQAWDCPPDCPVRLLDEQSGKIEAHHIHKQQGWKQTSGLTDGLESYGDSGSASRFFYQAKATNRERYFWCSVCETVDNDRQVHDNHRQDLTFHPTQKPQSLIKYLVKIVTPKNGVVLDPFIGSGTLGVAAEQLKFRWIGVEKVEIYCKIIKKRVQENLPNPLSDFFE